MTRPDDTDIDNALSPPNTVITTESKNEPGKNTCSKRAREC